jgi:anaerobic magnesium-protoporphyrin IX monomethyl ester cyclase
MMFRGAYDSEFYRRVRDLLHAQVTLQQSRTIQTPEHGDEALTALDAQWNALIANEYAHRTEHATSPVATIVIRHVATAQTR